MRWIIAVPLILAAGCATTMQTNSPQVTPATAAQIETCSYLDDLIGTSGMYGVFATRGADNALQDILVRAAAIGATHIVWTQTDAQHGSTSRQAKAHRCP